MQRRAARRSALIVLGLALGGAGGASAAPCRDLRGNFMVCPPAKIAPHCRDIKTKKPADCGKAGTEPEPAPIRRFRG